MSREQLTAQDGQQDSAAPDARSAEDVQGLPPRIYRQVMAIKAGPGGAEALAEVMDAFDGVFAERIAAVAARAPHLGNRIVQDAIQLSQARSQARTAPAAATPAASSFDKDEFRRSDATLEAGHDDDLRGLDGAQHAPLPAHLRAQVLALAPGDAAGLAQLLVRCPAAHHDELLLLARHHLGGSTVGKAVELKQQAAVRRRAAARPGTMPAGSRRPRRTTPRTLTWSTSSTS
jgi:hypothetical protein